MPVDITTNTIRVRQRDPGDFDQTSFVTQPFGKDTGIQAVFGKLKDGGDALQVQTLIFNREQWQLADVKKWIADHEGYTWPGDPETETPAKQEMDDDADDLNEMTDAAPADPTAPPDAENPAKYIKIQQHRPSFFSAYATKDYAQTPFYKAIDGDVSGIKVSLGKWKKTGAQVIQKFLFERAAGWTDERVKAWFAAHPQYFYPDLMASGVFVALSSDDHPYYEVEDLPDTQDAAYDDAFDTAQSVFDVILMREGWGKNRRRGPDGRLYRDYFTSEFMQSVAPLAEQSAVQAVKIRGKDEPVGALPALIKEIAADLAQYGHPPETVNMLFNLGLSGNTVGFLKNVRVLPSSSGTTPGATLRAAFVLAETPEAQQTRQLWQTAYRHGLSKALGLSINYKASVAFTERDGQPAAVFIQASQYVSCEFVPNAAAGGTLLATSQATGLPTNPGAIMTEEVKTPQPASPAPVPADVAVTQAATGSANAPGTATADELAGLRQELAQVKEMLKDSVTAQQGLTGVVSALQSAKTQENLTAVVQSSTIPDASKQAILAQIADGKVASLDAVQSLIALAEGAFKSAQPKFAPVIPGLQAAGQASVGANQQDWLKIRSLLTWGLPLTQSEQEMATRYNIRPFSGIKEEYQTYTGDQGMTLRYDPNVLLSRMHPGMFAHRGFVQDDGSFVQGITTTTYTDFLTHIINRTLEANYRNQRRDWEKMVQVGAPYNDVKDETHFVVGQFGELPTVAEGGSYTDIAIGALERVTSSNVKKGAIFQITEETLINDDLDYVRTAMAQIADAANRTIYRAVMDMVIGYGTAFNNATMTDTLGGVLYAAARRNLIDGSVDDFDKIRQLINLMFEQVDLMDDAGGKAPMILEPWLFIATMSKIGQVRARVKGTNEPGREDNLPNTLYLDNVPAENFIGVHPTYLREHPEALIVMPNPQLHAGLKISYFRNETMPSMTWEGNQQPAYGSVFSADTLKLRAKFRYRLYYQRLSAFYAIYTA